MLRHLATPTSLPQAMRLGFIDTRSHRLGLLQVMKTEMHRQTVSPPPDYWYINSAWASSDRSIKINSLIPSHTFIKELGYLHGRLVYGHSVECTKKGCERKLEICCRWIVKDAEIVQTDKENAELAVLLSQGSEAVPRGGMIV
jgi:hypothetical protein